MKKLIPLAAAAVVMAGTITAAQTTSHDKHGGHGAPASESEKATPSTAAFRAANDKMHAGMDIDFSGNADVDFVRGMIAHHQGAIDMARIELEYGKDPELRKLAEEIIRAQEGEIAMMKAWLEKNAK